MAEKAKQQNTVGLESTPDLSHNDQLTFILRSVNTKRKIVNFFLGYELIEATQVKIWHIVFMSDCAMVDGLGLELSDRLQRSVI